MYEYVCQECGQGTVREKTVRSYKTKIKGYPFVVREATIGVCDKCQAEHFAAQETKRWEELFYQSLVKDKLFLLPEDIQRVRKALGLSMEDFALLIGCTRQSLYNWEKDDRTHPQSRIADLLIKLVEKSHSEGNVDVIGFLVKETEKVGISLHVAEQPKVMSGIQEQVIQTYIDARGRVAKAYDDYADSQAPVSRAMELLITEAVKSRASEVHLEPQKDRLIVRFRIEDILHDVMSLPLSVAPPLVSRIKILANMNVADSHYPQHGQINFKAEEEKIDIRVVTSSAKYGERVGLHLLSESFPSPALGEHMKISRRSR